MAGRLGIDSPDESTDTEFFSTPLRPTLSSSMPDELSNVGVIEILSIDPRPSFIIDLEELKSNGWRPVYTNGACLSTLSDALVLRDDDGAGTFRAWAGDTSEDRTPQFRHNGKIWISYDLRTRWRIISGTWLEHLVETENSPGVSSGADGTDSSPSSWFHVSSRASTSTASHPVEEQDWVELLPKTAFVDNVFKAHDWHSTPLGSLANWPYVLRRSTRFVLADPAASCLFWGEKFCCIFNAGYSEIMGAERRENALGQPVSVVWPEIYERLTSIFREVRATRQACGWNSIQFFIERNGLLTETYWNWNLIPLMEDRSMTTGFYSTIHETTQQFIGNRRQGTLFAPVHARDTVTFWESVRANFVKNPWDAPFAAFYDICRPRRLSQDSDLEEHACKCLLRGSIGVPSGHKSFPTSTYLQPHATGVIPYLVKAARNRESMILTTEADPDFFELLDGIEWEGFGVASSTVVIFCLRLADEVLGFAVLGLNPRRPYNDDEHHFVDSLDTQLSASLSAAAMIERSHNNEVRLEERLAQSIEQTVMSDARYRAITELNPLGMINVTTRGETLYANKTWFEITGHEPEADYSKVSFRNIIMEDDLPLIDEEFRKMVENKEIRYYEIRLKKMRYYPEIHQWQHEWILCTGGPEYDESGNVRSVIGCVTDITAQKYAETIQSRHRQAAEEAKAAQEKFMDATSHEMRNPLSAIIQSAEDISSSLKEVVLAEDGRFVISKHAVDACSDAANIIALCAQHQTRIVDDVLTMSKLDSHMLRVTPVATKPLDVVNETLQMYKSEFLSSNIDTQVVVEPAYNGHGVEWVFCDPARLKQILINLISNAIKFTRQEAIRRITVNVTASTSKPPGLMVENIQWFSACTSDGSERHDLTDDPAWGDGEALYIGMAISDTGRGLSFEDRDKLFQRFSRANTLTHVHYGGSGLGLFISRELTEMQGGEVGVASKSGSGSAFAFYIKVRRAEAPRPELPLRTQSGQKVAQLAGLIADASQQVRPTQGITASLPPAVALPLQSPPPLKDKNFRILVVEDNIVNQRVITRQLVKAGCSVAIANHGQEALDYLQTTALWSANSGGGSAIDIALVDIEMPVMNGLTCARRIREHQKLGHVTCHLPLMAVTANARKEQIEECIAAGMDDVTIKPFRMQDLLAKVEQLIASRRSEE